MEGGAMKARTFQFDYAGLHGRPARCGLEIIELPDGKTVVIATELSDNPGVSVTNFAEQLATLVCKMFHLDPTKLVWIEHYPADPCPVCAGSGKSSKGKTCRTCGGRGTRREAASYDSVTLSVRHVRDGWLLSEPSWRPMTESTWRELGLEPRQ
jgi:hypothetical protein